MTTTALAMAPVASALCQRLNCRLVTALGKVYYWVTHRFVTALGLVVLLAQVQACHG